MNHIERVVVDEGVGPDSELMAQFRDRLGERQVVFVFLASEHPGIPDIEILDKLMDGRSSADAGSCASQPRYRPRLPVNDNDPRIRPD
jgi:hypothetical protein